MNKKLYVINVGLRELCLVGGYLDGMLFIQKVAAINTRKAVGLKKVRHEMAVYKSRGFFVTVSEPIPRLGSGYHACSLGEKDSNGQPRLVSAITAYQQLTRCKAIRFDKSVRQIIIPDSVYEKEVSNSGVTSYHIDWDSISEEALVLLVTIYNCVFHTSTETNYLRAVFDNLNKKKAAARPRFSLTEGKL